MKKFLAAGAMSVAVLGGSVAVATLTPIGSAAAQTAQSAVSTVTGHRVRPVAREAGKTAADAIGISPKDLLGELRSGKTITQVAQEHNVDPATVSQALVDAIDARIDQAVTNGHMADDTAAAVKGHVPQKVDTLMNHEFTRLENLGTGSGN